MYYKNPAALAAAQIDNTDVLNQIEQRGIARAFDIQKVKAIKRLRQSYVAAAQAGGDQQSEEELLPSIEPRSADLNATPGVAPDRARWRNAESPPVAPEKPSEGPSALRLERIPAPSEHPSASDYWQRHHETEADVGANADEIAEAENHSLHRGVRIINDVAGEGGGDYTV